ncbi:VWA domain-containing protein [Devosia naphthalenivorans]|uniref:VWA domain-containing protein n=1 Tax=Devosia naphthalenivorans TaxID=2082392 RepID=UPI000D3D4E76|nr:VWA domain-containing protein [Devosia naphthalenivorans]
MGFAAPAFLSLLLFGVAIALLHARRQRVKTVASLQLWKVIATSGAKTKANWHWPKISASLLLQLAILTALVLALAQPFWMRNAAPEHWLVVVDASASMQSTDVRPSRFEAATARLRSLLSATDGKSVPRFSLISAGHQTTLHAARVENNPRISDAYLRALSPSAGRTDWDAVATIAEPLIRPGEAMRILLFTDGEADGETRLSELPPAGVDVFRFSTPAANAGLTAAVREPEDVTDGTASAIVEGEVLLSGIESTSLTFEYTAPGNAEPLVWRTLDIVGPEGPSDPAGPQRVPFSVKLDLPQSGLVTARLPVDAATFDNEVHFRILSEPEPFSVLYLGEGNPPLLKALQAIDGVAIFEADGLPEDLQQFRLVIADGVELSREPDTNVLFVGAGRLASEPPTEPIEPSAPSRWDFEHKLARGIDFGALKINQAFRHDSDGEWKELLQADGAPLLLARDTDHGRQLRLAFRPADSNWPELTDFPVFVGNLVRWLGPAPGSRQPPSCQVGQACAVHAELRQGLLQAPSGQLIEAWGETQDGAPAFVPTQPGIYRIGAGATGYDIPVNAVAASESEDVSRPLADNTEAILGGATWEAWPGLLILALLLLVIEAWWTRRRSTSLASVAARRRWSLGQFLPHLLTKGFVALALFNVTLPYWTSTRNLVAISPDWNGAAVTSGRFEDLSLGLVTADATPLIDTDLGEMPTTFSPAASAANVEAALRLGAAMLPPGEPARIALIPPRRETIGDVSSVLRELVARNIAVDVVAEVEPNDQVALLNLEQAGRVLVGNNIPVTAIAFSDVARTATLSIMRGDEDVTAQVVALRPGYNRLQTVIPDAAGTGEVISLTLDSDDGMTENNTTSLITEVQPNARILILTPQLQQGEVLASLLNARNMETTVLEPRRAPWQLAQYLEYDAILLANVPAVDLDTRQQLLLEQSVAEHGRGLVIFGGENSFGPGGYLETPLERISPLSSKVPRDAPEAGLVFVLDRSGSMSQKVGESTRLEIAKQATHAAIGLLGEGSQVAIVVFDSEAQVPLPLQPASNAVAIQSAINTIDAGGGTAIVPGLVEGFRQLEGAEAPARHIVLMTDGLSTPGDVEAIMDAIGQEGITVSAVAIGEGADVTGLRSIANVGSGSFHATTDFQALPAILSQEAMLLSGSPIEEGLAQPQWTEAPAPDLLPISGPLPPIGGFVLTTAKDTADLSLVVPDREGEMMPLLASWRYGNGEVFALTTHAAGVWSQQALASAAYPRLINQVVHNVLTASRTEGLVLDLDRRRDEVMVRVEARDPVGQTRPDALVTATLTKTSEDSAPDVSDLTLQEISPGIFSSTFIASQSGSYAVAITADDQTRQAQVSVSYSDLFSPEPDEFIALAAATGGRVVSSLDELLLPGTARWTQVPATPIWALLALTMFLLDLGLRYLPLQRRRG